MADPIDARAPAALFLGHRPELGGAETERMQGEFRQLAVACRSLAVSEPAMISRITVSLPAEDDADAPERIADFALSLADQHGLEAEVEVSRGRVTVVFSRRGDDL